MRLLLDTHLLLWAAGTPERLPRSVQSLLSDASNTPIFSSASVWEIAIKHARKRRDFAIDPRILRRELIEHGYEELPILGEHALAAGSLPPIHGDPFDRMLVAQATVEGITLLTSDTMVARYPGPIRKV